MNELFKEIEEKGLNVECWKRGLKLFKINKIVEQSNQITIFMNNDDRIIISFIDDSYTITINKILKYKESTINYDWIKDLYLDFLVKNGAKLL